MRKRLDLPKNFIFLIIAICKWYFGRPLYQKKETYKQNLNEIRLKKNYFLKMQENLKGRDEKYTNIKSLLYQCIPLTLFNINKKLLQESNSHL